jgi:hypothetical protein
MLRLLRQADFDHGHLTDSVHGFDVRGHAHVVLQLVGVYVAVEFA